MISPVDAASARRLALVGAFACFALTSACGEDGPDPSQQATLPQRTFSDDNNAPPPPRRLTVADLNLAEGVEYPTPRIPTDAELARGIANLAGALRTGDSQAMQGLLTPAGGAVLSTLVESGGWRQFTESVRTVRVCTVLEEGDSASIGLGIADNTGAYLTAWSGMREGGAWKFEGLAVEPIEADSLPALDGAALAALPLPQEGAPVVIQNAPPPPPDETPEPQPQEGTRSRPRG